MSGGSLRLRRPFQMRSVSLSAKLRIMAQHYLKHACAKVQK
jgi:hypothetical protein